MFLQLQRSFLVFNKPVSTLRDALLPRLFSALILVLTYAPTFAQNLGGPCVPVIDNFTLGDYCGTVPQQVTVNVLGVGPFTYSWTGPNIVSPTTDATIWAANTVTGNYQYIVTVTNACGSVQGSTDIDYQQQPTGSFYYASGVGLLWCTDGGPVSPQTFNLTPGGTYSSSPAGLVVDPVTGILDPSLSNIGSYTVYYTIAAAACLQYQVGAGVILGTPPSINNFAYSDQCDAVPQSVTVNATGTGPLSYSWTGPNIVSPSTDQTIWAANTVTGEYEYVVTVTNASTLTNCSARDTSYIDYQEQPTGSFYYAPGPGLLWCTDGGPVSPQTFNLTPGGTYSSSPAGLVVDPVTGILDPSLSNIGSYTVYYTIAAAACPQYQVGAGVIMGTPPSINNFTYSDQCGAVPQSVTVNATGTGPLSYSWTGPNIVSPSTDQTIWAANTVTGEYEYVVTVTNTSTLTNCSARDTTYIDYQEQPTGSFNYGSGLGLFWCPTYGSVPPQTFNLTPGGTYSSVPLGLAVDPVTGVIDGASSSPDSYLVQYTIPAGSCPQYQVGAGVEMGIPQIWYADQDGDGAGDPNLTSLDCYEPTFGSWVTNGTDLCPLDINKLIPGSCGCGNPEPLTACDDGDPNTVNDRIAGNCSCLGTGPTSVINVYVKMMLQGPYNSATDLMDDDLRANGLLPLTDPYPALGYVHVGNSGAGVVDPSVFNATGNDAIVDWVVVEVRDPLDPSIVVASYSALLQRDGDVVDLNGLTPPLALGPASGFLYVAVRHRNHLACMTAAPVDFSSPSLNIIDLKDYSTSTYGSDARYQFDGFQMLWAGNVNFDERLKYIGASNDRDPILVEIGGSVPTFTTTGYAQEDVNMDGTVKYIGASNDRDPILVNIGGSVPTYTRIEQLP